MRHTDMIKTLFLFFLCFSLIFTELTKTYVFHVVVIVFTTITGILISRQHQYTRRINFLQRMQVRNVLLTVLHGLYMNRTIVCASHIIRMKYIGLSFLHY